MESVKTKKRSKPHLQGYTPDPPDPSLPSIKYGKYTLEFRNAGPGLGAGSHKIAAFLGNRRVGIMYWFPINEKATDSQILSIWVKSYHRRRGLATAMYEYACSISVQDATWPRTNTPKHSASRSPLGQLWAKSLGGTLPDLSFPPLGTKP